MEPPSGVERWMTSPELAIGLRNSRVSLQSAQSGSKKSRQLIWQQGAETENSTFVLR